MLLGVYFAKHEGKISLLLTSPNLVWLTWEKIPSFITIQIWSVILLWEKFPLVKYDREKFPNDILS